MTRDLRAAELGRGGECICEQEGMAVVRELQDIVDEHKEAMSGFAHLELSNFALRLYQVLAEPPLDAYHEHHDAEDDLDSLDGYVDRAEWAHDVLSDDELHENDDYRLRMPAPAERKLVDALFSVDRRIYTTVNSRRYLQAELSRHLDASGFGGGYDGGPESLHIVDGYADMLLRRYNSVRVCYKEAELKFSDVLRVVYDGAKILVMEERRFRNLRRDAAEERRLGGEARLKTFWLDRAYVEMTSAEHPEYTIPATRREAILLQRVGGFHHHVVRDPSSQMPEELSSQSVVVEGDILTTRYLVVTPALVDLAKRVHRGAMRRIPSG